MLKKIRKGGFLHYFWMVMAFYILNCSVDTPDWNRNSVPENLLINDQESLVEIVTEKLLGFENAIPESDDADCDESSVKKNFSLDTFTLAIVLEMPKTTVFHKEFSHIYSERFLDVSKPQHSPPPEA